MSEKRAELLLACVIIARSTSFVFNKLGLGTMTAFNLLAVRFLLAFALLALMQIAFSSFAKRSGSALSGGSLSILL